MKDLETHKAAIADAVRALNVAIYEAAQSGAGIIIETTERTDFGAKVDFPVVSARLVIPAI